MNFFLEADRSTAAHSRFEGKLRAYWHYREQGLHVKKFDIQSFRVLTVTRTEACAVNLCSLAASVVPERSRKFYLFTSLEHFSLENPTRMLDDV